MLIQKLAAFLAYHKVTRITPFDLYNWYRGRIEFTFTANVWTGDPDMPLAPRGCLVHKKVGEIISAFEKPGAVIYDDNIMDRFWQRGRLMLVTKDFHVFDEATTRISKRGCRLCGTQPEASKESAELLRVASICSRCNSNLGVGEPLQYNPLWTCRRTIVAGRYQLDYLPVLGVVRYSTRRPSVRAVL